MKRVLLMTILFANIAYAATQEAIFAGGCFWCMQSDFDKLPGVVNTMVGYDGGTTPNPTYELVSGHGSGYSEVVKVVFDDKKISYKELINYFFHHVDPTNQYGQFCDNGSQYTTKIFYLNNLQKKDALIELSLIKEKFSKVYTEVLPSTKFYMAEDYHQKYYKKNPIRYRFYRLNCGRDTQIRKVWNEK
jgi:peptide-methionine (S)-S-oxide reductase